MVQNNQFLNLFMQLENLEVWFQRPKDIVRKLKSGDLDLGIVGLDTVTEHGQVTFCIVCDNGSIQSLYSLLFTVLDRNASDGTLSKICCTICECYI